MSWLAFKEAVDLLDVAGGSSNSISPDAAQADSRLVRYRALRALESLAHCDSDLTTDQPRVVRAPTTIVRLPLAGPPQAIMSGARTEKTFTDLAELADRRKGTAVTLSSQNHDRYAPARILLRAQDIRALRDFAIALGVPLVEGPAAWSLINLSASLDDYEARLVWEDDTKLNWRHKDFDVNRLRFSDTLFVGSPVLRSYTNPINNLRMHFFIDGGKRAIVDRDWGRYLLIHRVDAQLLRYDKRRCVLAVPAGLPPPKLVERALVLCSGMVPDTGYEIGGVHYPMRIYMAVPLQIAEMAASKLKQRLTSFDYEQRGEHGC